MAKWSNRKKAAVGGAVVGATALAAVLLWPKAVQAGAAAKLELEASSQSVQNADGTVTVTVSASAIGGVEPYVFRIDWPDGQNDTNGFGSFTRTFSSAAVLPPDAIVTVKSADGQSVSVDG